MDSGYPEPLEMPLLGVQDRSLNSLSMTLNSSGSGQAKMAAERGLLHGGGGKPSDSEELRDGEEPPSTTVSALKSSPLPLEPAHLPAKDNSTNSKGTKLADVVLEADREDLLDEATEKNIFRQSRKGTYLFLGTFRYSHPCHPHYTLCSQN